MGDEQTWEVFIALIGRPLGKYVLHGFVGDVMRFMVLVAIEKDLRPHQIWARQLYACRYR